MVVGAPLGSDSRSGGLRSPEYPGAVRGNGLHPFGWLSEVGQRHALVMLGAATLVATTFLTVMGGPLRSPAAPLGIVSFELAGGAEAAGEILALWTPGLRRIARLHLWLDFGYLLLYPAFLSLACARTANARRRGLGRLGRGLSWGVLAAAPLDAVENLALLAMLEAGPGEAAARLAWACAAAKLALVAAALLYLPLAWLTGLEPTPRARPEGR